MEKEKRKSRPGRQWKTVSLLVTIQLLIICLIGACSYYISPGHSLSYFSRFETEEEVVAFLHDNFDLQITTSDDILTFMDAYPLERDGCRDSIPGPGDFANYVVDEDVTNIINCRVPVWHSFPGITYYHLRFYIDTDDLLVYISARWYCICI